MPPLLSPPKPTLRADSVRCCRNGVKSEPEPSGSSQSAASFSRWGFSASGVFITCRRRASSATGLPVRGSITSRATSVMNCCSPCDPPTLSQPFPELSVLM